MNSDAMDPYGRALWDYFTARTAVEVSVQRDDGFTAELPVSVFFREPPDFSPLEQTALEMCRGAVLDVGAGAGCHSLVLQAQGIKVSAIDICPQAVDIMSMRGVKQVQCADVFEFQAGPFDTILMLMHGIGLVGDLRGLDRFLRHIHTLLKADGQILFDSLDVRCTDDPRHLAYQQANLQAGRYFGQVRTRFEYKGHVAPFFAWLHVDPATLAHHAENTGWSCQVVHHEASGDYLAQLTPLKTIGKAEHIQVAAWNRL